MTNRINELEQKIAILEKAYTASDRAMMYWKAFKEYASDEALQNHLWAEYTHHNGLAEGLLFAYETLTGIQIFSTPTYINSELDKLQDELQCL